MLCAVAVFCLLSCSSNDDGNPKRNLRVTITGVINGEPMFGKAFASIVYDSFGDEPLSSEGTAPYNFTLQNEGKASYWVYIIMSTDAGPHNASDIHIKITDKSSGELLIDQLVPREVGFNNSLDDESCRRFDFKYYIEDGEVEFEYE